MANLKGYADGYWHPSLAKGGLRRVSIGKVREGYIDDDDLDRILFLATNRISIFNFVLPALVPRKGEVLTALSHFVMTRVLTNFIGDMLLPGKSSADAEIWNGWHQRHPEIPWERCALVHKYDVEPYEAIFRFHPGGSVWKSYQKDGIVAGQQLPSGLVKWCRLDEAIFTPTYKSEEDEPLTIQEFLEKNPGYGQNVIDVLRSAYNHVYQYFSDLGILILDTKFEYGIDQHGNVVLLDEKFTPDSSRFVQESNWIEMLGSGSDPAFQDKEVVRAYGKCIETPFFDDSGNQIIGLHNLKGSNPDHIEFVNRLIIPSELLEETSRIYLDIFKKATGYDLDAYQHEVMGIAA